MLIDEVEDNDELIKIKIQDCKAEKLERRRKIEEKMEKDELEHNLKEVWE